MGISDFLHSIRTGLKTENENGTVTLIGYTKKADNSGTLTIPEDIAVIAKNALRAPNISQRSLCRRLSGRSANTHSRSVRR